VPASATSTEPGHDLPAGGEAALVEAVQRNCDLADAHHAGEKSLCIYLLGMREYYRWEAGVPLGQAPQRERLSGWIADRERRWDLLREQGASFSPLPLADGIDPFDEDAANHWLAGRRLVYGAGIGLFGAPLFFLAACRSDETRDGARVIVADRELARGFVATPAVSRGTTVIVRLDALRRWLWTRIEAARRGPAADAFAAALRAYGDPDDAATVERMTQGEAETLILHELGELKAAAQLGGEWEAMLAEIRDRRTELVVRAVRDLLADCLVTLPALIERQADASLNFWLSNFDGLRRVLAPDLAAACGPDRRRIDPAALDRAARLGRKAWRAVADDLLSSWRRGGRAALQARTAILSAAG